MIVEAAPTLVILEGWTDKILCCTVARRAIRDLGLNFYTAHAESHAECVEIVSSMPYLRSLSIGAVNSEPLRAVPLTLLQRLEKLALRSDAADADGIKPADIVALIADVL